MREKACRRRKNPTFRNFETNAFWIFVFVKTFCLLLPEVGTNFFLNTYSSFVLCFLKHQFSTIKENQLSELDRHNPRHKSSTAFVDKQKEKRNANQNFALSSTR